MNPFHRHTVHFRRIHEIQQTLKFKLANKLTTAHCFLRQKENESTSSCPDGKFSKVLKKIHWKEFKDAGATILI